MQASFFLEHPMNGTQDGRYYKFCHPNSYWGDPNVAHKFGWDLVCCVPRECINSRNNDGLVVYRRASPLARLWRWMKRTNPRYWFKKVPF